MGAGEVTGMKQTRTRALFATFFKIGAFTFGGGYAMVALLEHEFVEEKQWVTREEFLDMVAIAESTPGPMAVNSATYIGYKLEGVPGAAASTLAVCLPSFAVIYAISLFFDQFLQLSVVSSAFRGIQVCVVYLVLSAGLKMLKNLKKDAFSRAVLAAVLLAMVSCSVLAVSFSSIFYILLSGAAGLAVYGVQQLRKECSAAGTEAFPLEEPLSACRRAYRQLRRALDSDWERYYAAAKQMTAEGKTLDVPRSYSFGGVAVGRWLENQRLVRAGKKKGRLTAEQAARLDKIGMNWKKRLELAWENGCASARRYRGSHSDLLVPVHYKDKDGFALGEWIVYNRQRYLSGNLPSDRVERLEALGMVWDTGSILWEKSYAAAVQYYLENHTLEIPVKYVTPDGMALGVWLGSQRAAYKEGVLTDAQIEKLEALEVDWTNRNDRKWQTAYEAAVKYHAAHGNLDVPTEYTDEDGILLGKWVSRQRYAWQNPERSSARVTPERKALLDELGMNWEKTDSWQHRYELAVEYKKEHGSLAVPAQYRTEDGIWLGSWLSRQKQMLREGKKLSAERRAALKELFKGEKGRRLSAPVPPAARRAVTAI